MENENGFEIRVDTLGDHKYVMIRKYTGPEVEVLEIPEGVTCINYCILDDEQSMRAFNKCKKIVFPTSMKIIQSHLPFHALEEVVFKGDIETIETGAFDYVEDEDAREGTIGIKSIVFEGHVKCIEDKAFRRSRITSFEAPNGIEKLCKNVFEECTNLESVVISGLKTIGKNCFLNCKNLVNLEIPTSCRISDGVFVGCERLENAQGQLIFHKTLFSTRADKSEVHWVSIPDGVSTIDEYAFQPGDSLVIPLTVRNIKNQRGRLNKIGYEDNYFKTEKKLSGEGFLKLLARYWAKTLSAEDWAYLYIYQTDKHVEEILSENDRDVNEVIQGMIIALNAFGKEKHFARASEYVISNIDRISQENLQTIHKLFKKKGKKLASVLSPYLGEFDEDDPYAEWRKSYNEYNLDESIKARNGNDKLFKKVRLAGTTEMAPAYIVKCAIVPYLDQYTENPRYIGDYKTGYYEVEIVDMADKAAALLDKEDIQKLLEKEYKEGGSAWLLPYGRYASETRIDSLMDDMADWEYWGRYGAAGRREIITARGGMMLSDTRKAMMDLEKKGLLDDYAEMRGTDADSIRDRVLAEFGLDCEGKKVYDLGTKRITVSLTPELTLSLYDESKQKIIKSIPKKDTDAKLAEEASEDFAEMKTNVKKVVKSRNDVLFNDFLSGKTRKANNWIASYTQNPVLRQVAKLLVWTQGNDTFTLTETGAVDCNGTEYVIGTDKNIGLAHPMEMKIAEVGAWQKYFNNHGLKQPFLQIWEPVIADSSITEDRYKGCMIPFYQFRNRVKHGITVNDMNFHNDIEIHFSDCDADVFRIDDRRHEIRNEDNFEVRSFRFKEYNRRVNHIVAYLDNVVIKGLIRKDDIQVVSYLSQVTLAQITEFIKLASENNCTNVMALLLDYKQKAFPEFDPMAEFTLDL